MKFSNYEKAIEPTIRYKSVDLTIPSLQGLIYTTLGLSGEAGEALQKIAEAYGMAIEMTKSASKTAEQVKKIIRDNNGLLSHEVRKRIALELGDNFWFLTRAANEIGYSLQEIAELNLEKVLGRLERGKLGGSGDER